MKNLSREKHTDTTDLTQITRVFRWLWDPHIQYNAFFPYIVLSLVQLDIIKGWFISRPLLNFEVLKSSTSRINYVGEETSETGLEDWSGKTSGLEVIL